MLVERFWGDVGTIGPGDRSALNPLLAEIGQVPQAPLCRAQPAGYLPFAIHVLQAILLEGGQETHG